MTLSPERLYQTWDVLQRASAAFLVLLHEVDLTLPGEELTAQAERLEQIHDQVVRVSNEVYLQLFTLGVERRRGERRQT